MKTEKFPVQYAEFAGAETYSERKFIYVTASSEKAATEKPATVVAPPAAQSEGNPQ